MPIYKDYIDFCQQIYNISVLFHPAEKVDDNIIFTKFKGENFKMKGLLYG